MTREEEEREQAEFDRKADAAARKFGPGCWGCVTGIVPAIALIFLPPLLLVL